MNTDSMIAVIICTVNRPAVLHDTVVSATSQTVAPLEVIISCPDNTHINAATLTLPGVRLVNSPIGSSIQRNRGAEAIASSPHLVCFLDDDIELHPCYFENMAVLFKNYPETVLASGRLLADGAKTGQIERDSARQLLAAGQPVSKYIDCPTAIETAYGCNMVVRADVLKNVTFDETLSLYAWLEDADFSDSCRTYGAIVSWPTATAVHLGVRSGRVSGRRFGFSQIVNPYYLAKKRSDRPRVVQVIRRYWLPALVANTIGLIMCDSSTDRAGRLYGNILGLKHVCTGTCDPSAVRTL